MEENISAISPLPHQLFSLAFLGSFCALYLSFWQRLSVCRMFCETKWSGSRLSTASVLFIWYLQVIFHAFDFCCEWLAVSTLFSIIWEGKRLKGASSALILNTAKASHFPTDYPHFKMGWGKSCWREGRDDHFWQNDRVHLFLGCGK